MCLLVECRGQRPWLWLPTNSAAVNIHTGNDPAWREGKRGNNHRSIEDIDDKILNHLPEIYAQKIITTIKP